jgi:hypothetical protein
MNKKRITQIVQLNLVAVVALTFTGTHKQGTIILLTKSLSCARRIFPNWHG